MSKNIIISSDSTCDLSQELYGIGIISFTLNVALRGFEIQLHRCMFPGNIRCL